MTTRSILTVLAACAVVAAPAAFAAASQTYKGTVKKQPANKVSITVVDGKLTKFVGRFKATCGPTPGNVSMTFPSPLEHGRTGKIVNNKFRIVWKDPAAILSSKSTITGTFSGKKVTGTLSVKGGMCVGGAAYSASR